MISQLRSHARPYPSGPALALLGLLGLALGAGCASDSWDRAMEEGRAEVFYEFIRENPDSPRVAEARERLAFFELQRNPSLANFNAFVDEYPESSFADELRPELEETAFRVARAAGTADAWTDFLRRFPDADRRERALGNRAFLEAEGFGGDPVALADFARRHPESDFAPEARRTAESLQVRERTRFRDVALEIEIAPTTPEAERLIRSFSERAEQSYRAAGVRLHAPGSDGDAAEGGELAVLRIVHEEAPVEASTEGGELGAPGFEARTAVSLTAPGADAPLWRRDFVLPVDPATRKDDASLLFGPEGGRYWQDFFVPVATWHSLAALREAWSLDGAVADVQAAGDRVVVLFESGAIQILELSDPTEPIELLDFDGPSDLSRWSGLRRVPSGLVAFGEDGLASFRFAAGSLEPVHRLGRARAGSVTAVAPIGGQWAVGSRRGLLLVDPEQGTVLRLLSRGVDALDAAGERVLFGSGESLYLSTVPMLRKRRVLAQLSLPGEQLRAIRMFGDTAVAITERTTWVLSTPADGTPRVAARISVEETGPVRDASLARGRIFLLGRHGMIAVDPRDWSADEMVDVRPAGALATMGRHLVAVGERELQVVDSTPFTSRAAGLPAEAAFDAGDESTPTP